MADKNISSKCAAGPMSEPDCGPKPLYPKKTTDNTSLIITQQIKSEPVKIDKQSKPTATWKLFSQTKDEKSTEKDQTKGKAIQAKITESLKMQQEIILNKNSNKNSIIGLSWLRSKAFGAINTSENKDLNSRLKKMSWGSNITSKCSRGKSFICGILLFGIKIGVASGLCYYSAHEGLWGTYEETQFFYTNILGLFNIPPK